MSKPRVMIADTDRNYMIPLQAKFAEEFQGNIELEIITDAVYFEQLFSIPQKVDVLIVSDRLYSEQLRRHDIGFIFILMEQMEEGRTDELSVSRLFKYTSIREIFNEITGKSAELLQAGTEKEQSCQIILVCSAAGGTGKTAVAMGLAECLTKNYKKVLYINAEKLQTFQYRLKDRTALEDPAVYRALSVSGSSVYQNLRPLIRKEGFSYLPPFKGPLMALGLQDSVYRNIAEDVRKKNEYDFIIIDTDSVFDEEKAALMGAADKVVVVTGQTETAALATDTLAANINGSGSEKYIFVCNDFRREEENFFTSSGTHVRFQIHEYIDHIPSAEKMTADRMARDAGIQKTAFLIM